MTTEEEFEALLKVDESENCCCEDCAREHPELPEWQDALIEVFKSIYEIEMRLEAVILLMKSKGTFTENEYQLAYDHVFNDQPESDTEDFLTETVKRFRTKLESTRTYE